MSSSRKNENMAPELRVLNIDNGSARVRVGDQEISIRFRHRSKGVFDIQTSSGWARVHIADSGRGGWWVHDGQETFELKKSSPSHSDREASRTKSGEVRAPTPGKIVRILVQEGDSVEEGDRLLVLESMKTEQSLMAEVTGKVETISAVIDQQVLMDEMLLSITPAPEETEKA